MGYLVFATSDHDAGVVDGCQLAFQGDFGLA